MKASPIALLMSSLQAVRTFALRFWKGGNARRYQAGAAVILALAGLGFFLYNRNSVEFAEIAVVRRGTAVAGVYGTVNVEPVNQLIVRTRQYGQVTQLNIKEGRKVKNGDVLAQISDDSFQRQFEANQSALDNAKARLKMGPASNAALRNKEIEVEKLKKLLDAGNIAPIEYEKAVNELTSLREIVQKEQMNLDMEVENLTRATDQTRSKLDQMQVISPLDGVVLNIYCHLGEFVPPQAELCRIGSSDNQIVAQINEEDVGYLRPGLKAKIRLYSHRDRDLTGVLKEILPQAENQSYRVVFSLEDPPDILLPGMTGEMNIIISEHNNVLTIPTRAIRKGNIVYRIKNGVVGQVVVKSGFRTMEKTEILQGLDEGDRVILSNHDLYPEGVRVRSVVVKDN
ncbi:MAG: efflux RND transporter periplasmic adaptor subunit [Candidatus Methylacidiphilales bacterium]|nr:efflux RND transporter periplasmic adaptor subunit [Candidatus Methylacidiphilales bacterium]